MKSEINALLNKLATHLKNFEKEYPGTYLDIQVSVDDKQYVFDGEKFTEN